MAELSTEKSTTTSNLIINNATVSPNDANSSNTPGTQIVPQIQSKVLVDSSVTDQPGNVPIQPAMISANAPSTPPYVSSNVVDSKGQAKNQIGTDSQALNTPATGSDLTTSSSLNAKNNFILATSTDPAVVPNLSDKPISSTTATNQSQISSLESKTPGEGDKGKNIGDEAAALTSETPSEITNSINQLNASDLDSNGKNL